MVTKQRLIGLILINSLLFMVVVCLSIGINETKSFIILMTKEVQALVIGLIIIIILLSTVCLYMYVSSIILYIISRNIFAIRIEYKSFLFSLLVLQVFLFLGAIWSIYMVVSDDLDFLSIVINPFIFLGFLLFFMVLKKVFHNISVNPLLFTLFLFALLSLGINFI